MPSSAVVDASVLVSAFLFPGSIPGRVIRLARQGRFVMRLSPILLDETRDALLSVKLRVAYRHDEDSVAAWIGDIAGTGQVFLGPLPDITPVCREPNDDHVLATAVATDAELIVTGDKDLLALANYRMVRIITPRVFLTDMDASVR